MTNYIKQTQSLEEAENLLISDLTNTLTGVEIISKTYGDGTIKTISRIGGSMLDDETTAVATLLFGTNEHDFYLTNAINRGFITFKNESLLQTYNDFMTEAKEIQKQKNIKLQEELKKKHEEEAKIREELKQQERIKRAQIKAEDRKKTQLNAAHKISKSTTHHISDQYYYALGYIAKHIKKITAAMPDYLEKWFVREFGDVERRVVDQAILSPSGLPGQFALAMKIDLDTNENIPSYISKYLGNVNKEVKPISNTQFVFDIMKNEGFVFGKKQDQDLDKILDEIPSQYLDDFHAGYAL